MESLKDGMTEVLYHAAASEQEKEIDLL